MDGWRPNRGNKAAFPNSSGVEWTLSKMFLIAQISHHKYEQRGTRDERQRYWLLS